MLASVPSEVTTVLLELGLILLGLAVLARVASRLGISAIPLFLLTGLLFGVGGVIPVVTAESFIEVGAELGVILLLFSLGLEYSARKMVATLRRSSRAGALDAALNFTPGYLAGILLGWGAVESLFLGGITYISSSGIVATILEERGWKSAAEGRLATSLLVIEDLAMALFLPVLAVLANGGGGVEELIRLIAAISFAGALFWMALRFGSTISKLVFSHVDQALILAIVGLTLSVAGVAERFQISAEVGAFLVGVMVSGPTARRSKDLTLPLRELFSALFFLFFGFGIDPADIPPVLAPAVALAVVTALTKVGAVKLEGGLSGLKGDVSTRAGVVMIPRGEFSMAIAAIAVVAGVGAQLAPLTAAYVLILAVVGPLLSSFLLRRALPDPPNPSPKRARKKGDGGR